MIFHLYIPVHFVFTPPTMPHPIPSSMRLCCHVRGVSVCACTHVCAFKSGFLLWKNEQYFVFLPPLPHLTSLSPQALASILWSPLLFSGQIEVSCWFILLKYSWERLGSCYLDLEALIVLKLVMWPSPIFTPFFCSLSGRIGFQFGHSLESRKCLKWY